MFSKYRILEKDGIFYPQHRFLLFFYANFSERIGGLPLHRIYITVRRKTLKEAEDFLFEYIGSIDKDSKKKTKTHPFDETKNH